MWQNECRLKNGAIVRYSCVVFGRGEYKTAHLGEYVSGEHARKSVVVKVFRSTEKAFKNGNTVRITRIARKLAAEFNEFKKTNSITPLEFLMPVAATVTRVSLFSCFFTNSRLGDVVTIEDRIFGSYEKFVSNNGTLLYHGTLSTFVHWTYWKTKQKLMIVDLQGERQEHKYILTDPAIHSVRNNDNVRDEDAYGELDCGVIGIEAFFSTHKCDKICSKLPKPANIRYTPADCEREMRRKITRAHG
jgi:hypothetical protein